MLEDKQQVKIKNRYNGFVTYTVPDLNNLVRNFAPGEMKSQVTVEELRLLNGQIGGRRLLEDFLVILDCNELIEELFPGKLAEQPEYTYDDKDILHMLTEASVDAFKDFIDFAPLGILEIVKDKSVSLPLQSYDKRQYLLDRIGFDVDAAIRHFKESQEDEVTETAKPSRRVKAEPAAETNRRTPQPVVVK